MFRPKHKCPPDKLREFVNDALAAFSLFFDALQERGESVAAVAQADAGEYAAQLSGPLGRFVRARLITQRDMDDFLRQPAPRQVPENIRLQQVGGSPWFLYLWGILFGGIGSVVMVGMLFAREWLGVLFASLFPLIGFSVLYFTARSRRRNLRLLRDGKVVQGWIEQVEETQLWVNGQRRYRATLRFSPGVEEERHILSLYGPAVRRAEASLARNEPVRVLFLPDQPKRLIVADALVSEMN
jgi:hypothetical protein